MACQSDGPRGGELPQDAALIDPERCARAVPAAGEAAIAVNIDGHVTTFWGDDQWCEPYADGHGVRLVEGVDGILITDDWVEAVIDGVEYEWNWSDCRALRVDDGLVAVDCGSSDHHVVGRFCATCASE
jgi:hypothetical protein